VRGGRRVERMGRWAMVGGLPLPEDTGSQVVCSVGQRNSQSGHRPYHKL